MVFAAYWSEIPIQRSAGEILGRWLPMEVKTPRATVRLDAAWFEDEVAPSDSSRDVFDRVATRLVEEALPRGWDGQVG